MTTRTPPATLPDPPSVLAPARDTSPDVVRSPTATAAPVGRAGPWRPSVGLIVASILSFFVFALLNWPEPAGWSDLWRPLLFLDTTPSGGDMGAHVWGPAFLRDELLPAGRLSGWTPDWYAGFPAFQFYMVVPALAIIALNVGLPWFVGLPAAAGVLYGARRLAATRATTGRWVMAAGVLVAVLVVGMPYGVAFKLVSVSGLILFPLAAWAMGRLARAPEPIPAFLSMAAFVFLFDTNFSIYGGNLLSTLAGEFAFSISLCLSLLAIGLVLRGMDDQRWRAPAAIVVALVALCHIIPVFFLVPALLLGVLATMDGPRSWTLAGMIAFALVPIAFADGTGIGIKIVAVAAAVIVMLSAMAAEPVIAARARWLLLVGPTAILLTAFWLVPFYLREPYFNDMGWERLNAVGAPLLTVPIKIALPIAAVGFLAAMVSRERIGMIFTGTAVLGASAVANLPEGALWNARLLPFYYLSVYVVAAVGLGFVARYLASTVSGEIDRPDGRVIGSAVAAGAVAVLIAVSMPLRILPFASDNGAGYRWLGFTNTAASLAPTWIQWNYSGYEEKPSYGEYNHVVSTMATVGDEQGCGRAMWEYEKGLDRYGTPMALMLLPHWTDGCIGSMEGLYFESSATTPFHFLNQSVLSEAPSRAQRDLPYLGFDIDVGIDQLQVMGVRYYLAQSDTAIAAAREHPDLTEITEAQPFVVFEVAGSELVEGLSVQPVIAAGRTAEEVAGPEGDPEEIARFEVGWVSQAVAFYNNPGAYPAIPAEDGPDEWAEVTSLGDAPPVDVDPVEVTIDEVDTDSISFTVDRTGAPVLVKVSYFPNWEVDGADGPYRVGPNLMAVVPTSERVELSYGRTAVDFGGQGLTGLGLAAVLGLGLLDRGRLSLRRRTADRVDPAVTEAGLAGLGLDGVDDFGELGELDAVDPGNGSATSTWFTGVDEASGEPADGPGRAGESGESGETGQPDAIDEPGAIDGTAADDDEGDPSSSRSAEDAPGDGGDDGWDAGLVRDRANGAPTAEPVAAADPEPPTGPDPSADPSDEPDEADVEGSSTADLGDGPKPTDPVDDSIEPWPDRP
ncbi:MAG: hypothetical protein AAGA93_21710 [Actinomycetota bacterium]